MRITRIIHGQSIFHLSSQVANALSNTTDENQQGRDGFLKETIPLGVDMQENDAEKNSNGDQMQCHGIV